MRTAMLILGALLLIGTSIGCDRDSFAADKMVESFYKALNAGDTARAKSHISPADTTMLAAAEEMASCMAGKIQKVEILDIMRSEGVWGGPPFTYVWVRVTCATGVPTSVSGRVKTCGDVMITLGEYESGWKIVSVEGAG